MIVYVPFIVLYLVYGSRPYDTPLVGGFFPTPTNTPVFTSTPTITYTPTQSTIPTLAYVLPATYYPTSTALYQSNGVPSGFPFITDKGSYYLTGQRVLFSYYFPDLGGVNCHADNWVDGRCKNVTASKVVGWREYLGKGLAIHSDMYDELPFGSQVYVVNPPSIAGTYTVVDLCCGCKNQNGYYFDFLFTDMPAGVSWSYNVDFVVTRYGWDVELITVPAPVCLDAPYTATPSRIPSLATATSKRLFTSTVIPSFTPTLTVTSTELPSLTPTP